jgi:nucleoid-associated protein YgaU
MINNYDKMKRVQNSLEELAQNTSEQEKEDMIPTMGDNITVQEEEQDEQKEEQQDTMQQDTVQQDTVQQDVGQKDEEQQNGSGEEGQSVQTEVRREYIVQKGDTLEIISIKEYGDVLHVEAICKLNGLEDGNLILIGQKLLLP